MSALGAAKHWVTVQFFAHIKRTDIVLASLMTFALFLWLWRASRVDDLGCFLKTDGTGIYGALLSSVASLLGFTIAAITIVSALVSTPQFEKFRRSKHYDDLWLAFTWTIRALGVAAVVALLSLFANHYEDGRIAIFGCLVWSVALAAFSLLRSGVTLEELLYQSRELEVRSCAPLTKPSPNPTIEP